jgi:hypothetical protein
MIISTKASLNPMPRFFLFGIVWFPGRGSFSGWIIEKGAPVVVDDLNQKQEFKVVSPSRKRSNKPRLPSY